MISKRRETKGDYGFGTVWKRRRRGVADRHAHGRAVGKTAHLPSRATDRTGRMRAIITGFVAVSNRFKMFMERSPDYSMAR